MGKIADLLEKAAPIERIFLKNAQKDEVIKWNNIT